MRNLRTVSLLLSLVGACLSAACDSDMQGLQVPVGDPGDPDAAGSPSGSPSKKDAAVAMVDAPMGPNGVSVDGAAADAPGPMTPAPGDAGSATNIADARVPDGAAGACGVGLLGCTVAGAPAMVCVNPADDERHCGACGRACASGRVCLAGVCVCSPGQTACDGRCVDLDDDEKNCGRCGATCGLGQLCSRGRCTVSCDSGRVACGSSCADLSSNSRHCGTCGKTCSVGKVCRNGGCVCPSGTTECAGRCVNTLTDGANCGACNHACKGNQTCNLGDCGKDKN